MSGASITRWIDEGYLHRRLPGVYAVGHTAPSIEGRLSEALLYAGTGSMLSHVTALWWFGLLSRQPGVIHVSTPRRVLARRGVRVHAERHLARHWHNGLPTTLVAQALLDHAATATLNDVRYMLAEAEYRRLLDLDEVEGILGHGRRGSAKLRKAMKRHEPRLARTRSENERLLLRRCEAAGIPLPEFNAKIGWMTVDAVWWEQRVAVEIDGYGGHRTRAQVERDRRRELHARRHGFTSLRYSGEQLATDGELVDTDLRAALRLDR